MNQQKIELKKMLSENKLLWGKRVELISLPSKTENKWLFTVDGKIRNINHFLSPEQIAFLNTITKEAK
jgi:hypothetical protein